MSSGGGRAFSAQCTPSPRAHLALPTPSPGFTYHTCVVHRLCIPLLFPEGEDSVLLTCNHGERSWHSASSPSSIRTCNRQSRTARGQEPTCPPIHRGPWPACDAQQEPAPGPPTPGTCSLVLEQLTTCLPRGPPCISPPSRWLPFSTLLACSRTQRACFFLPPARLGAPLPHLGAPSAWPYHSSSAHCPFPSFRPGQPPHPKPYTHSLLLLQAQLPPTAMSPSPTEGRTSGQASAGEPTRPPAAWGGLSGEDDVTFSGVLAAGLCTRQAGRPSPD